MRRRRRYILLAFMMIFLAGFGRLDFFTVEEVKKDSSSFETGRQWNRLISEDINSNTVELSVDGRVIPESKGSRIFITGNRTLMIPKDMVAGAFSCAADFYDNSRLVIERNGVLIEMVLHQDKMTVNGVEIKVEEGLTMKGGKLYVPVSAIADGLSYSVDWAVDERRLSLTSKNKGARLLPYAYDYRQNGRVPAIKNQGTLGTCWSFASLMALETSLLPEEPMDFSEDNMSINNSFHLNQNDGGEYTMSMAYLLAWQGPVLEEDDPYGDSYSPPGLEPVKHVQEIQILPSKDFEKIKTAVYQYGGVQSSLYTSLKNEKSRSVYYNREKAAYCYIGTEKPNHDVVIVGWDDNYPKENFSIDLEGDGAFICTNSWGQEFGDGGFFYVSYYDTNIGIHNILYTSIEDSDNYDRIYQSDLCGWVGQLGYGKESAYFANVYTADGGENLEAVGFYATGADTRYQVFTVKDFNDIKDFAKKTPAAEGEFENSGYYTVDFDQPLELKAGERFAVVVKITTPGSVHPIAIEYDAADRKQPVDLSDGEGYVSFRGNSWERAEEMQNCNICLKAYTAMREE